MKRLNKTIIALSAAFAAVFMLCSPAYCQKKTKKISWQIIDYQGKDRGITEIPAWVEAALTGDKDELFKSLGYSADEYKIFINVTRGGEDSIASPENSAGIAKCEAFDDMCRNIYTNISQSIDEFTTTRISSSYTSYYVLNSIEKTDSKGQTVTNDAWKKVIYSPYGNVLESGYADSSDPGADSTIYAYTANKDKTIPGNYFDQKIPCGSSGYDEWFKSAKSNSKWFDSILTSDKYHMYSIWIKMQNTQTKEIYYEGAAVFVMDKALYNQFLEKAMPQ